jgi:hypothetical protein
MKKVLIVVAFLFVVVVVIGIVVVLSLGTLVETGVETGGTLILGVPTTLEDASVSVLGGSAGLDGLVIGSPEGFSAPEMFKLGHAHTAVDIGSLMGDELLVHEVVIDGPEVTLEFAGMKTNWGALMARLRRPPASPEERDKGSKKVRVERIAFFNGKIHIAGITPLGGKATVPLPDFELTEVGGGEGGSGTVRQKLSDIVTALFKSVISAAGDVVPAERLADLKNEFEAVTGQAVAALKGAGAAAQEAGKKAQEAGAALKDAGAGVGKKAGEATEKARDVLGGILGGKEEGEE